MMEIHNNADISARIAIVMIVDKELLTSINEDGDSTYIIATK